LRILTLSDARGATLADAGGVCLLAGRASVLHSLFIFDAVLLLGVALPIPRRFIFLSMVI
jgi:hypothetical protein